MKKLYSHENRLIVFNLRNQLDAAGIDCVVINEFASGGIGGLAAFDTWPELWISDPAQFERAEALLQTLLNADEGSDWYCRGCQEVNASAFELCWNCGKPDE